MKKIIFNIIINSELHIISALVNWKYVKIPPHNYFSSLESYSLFYFSKKFTFVDADH
jgi:hypothetical protein